MSEQRALEYHEKLRKLKQHIKSILDAILDNPEWPKEVDPPLLVPLDLRGRIRVKPADNEYKLFQKAVYDYRNIRQQALDISAKMPNCPNLPGIQDDPVFGLQTVYEWTIAAMQTGESSADGDKKEKAPKQPTKQQKQASMQKTLREVVDHVQDNIKRAEKRGNDTGQDNANQEKPTVTDSELTVLQELNEAQSLLSQIMLSSYTSISRNTLKRILPSLEKRRLIHRPQGTRGGYAITESGKKVS